MEAYDLRRVIEGIHDLEWRDILLEELEEMKYGSGSRYRPCLIFLNRKVPIFSAIPEQDLAKVIPIKSKSR